MFRGHRSSPIPPLIAVTAAAVAAIVLCLAPSLTQLASAQTAGDTPPQTASIVAPVSAPAANPAEPVIAAAQNPAPTTAVQPADAGTQTVDAAPVAVDQAPRPGPPPAPRGPVSVQGPARGAPAPAKAVSVQGPQRGPAGAYPGRRAGGRRGGPYRYGRGGPAPAVRQAAAPRLPNAGAGGLLDSALGTSQVTPWLPAALLLMASALGGAGVLASKRRS
jgi:hypothetical protein